ncbi:hypothetical protein ABTH81_22445, partial [Acinetobacter baumannii]
MRYPDIAPSPGDVHLTSREVGTRLTADWLSTAGVARLGGSSPDASNKLRAAVAPAIVKIRT